MVLNDLKIVYRFVNCNLHYTNTVIVHTKLLFHFFAVWYGNNYDYWWYRYDRQCTGKRTCIQEP